jgi:structure-specific recognition protein 1
VRLAAALTRFAAREQSGDVVSFHGFRDADVATLKEHAAAHFPAVPVTSGEVSVSGKNWGEATVRGSQLVFAVAAKPAFHVNCSDISAVSQQGKTDVLLEFAVDDTTGATEKDALFELSFHVPPTSTVHAAPAPADGDEEGAPVAAKVLADAILARASVGPITGEPIALFSEVAVLIPRGRFSLEMHGATMRLVGQAADFKVQYTSILRLFVLPRPAAPTTLAVLALDPPIRRGATFYPHLVLQFSAEEEVEMEPSVPPELADKYAGRLEPRYSGAEADVFAKVLKALAGTKVTRAGTFQSPSGGSAVRCVHKADDGHLYPLEKAFFFLPKPPIFIRHDEVAEVEFERNAGGGKTFDIKILLTSDQSYRFTNIARSEYDNLMAFLTAKKLPVASLAAPQRDLAAGLGLSDSDDEGLGMPGGGGGEDEDSEEDADFKAASGPSGSESSSESEEGEEGGDGEAGGGTPAEKPAKAAKKRKEPKEKAADGKPEKKKRAKKDPNGALACVCLTAAGQTALTHFAAPKKGLSAFMFFSKERRAQVVADNPGIAFGDVGKKLGEAWKALPVEERAPFEAQAAADKERFKAADKAYKASKASEPAADEEEPASDADGEEADMEE